MMTEHGRPGTVVVVDDDDAVRDSLQILLESAGFTVEAFASPVEFLASPAPAEAGCLLVDVRMPEMDGIQVQETLNAGNTQLPVIVMTGHADVPLAVRAMKAGAVDFVEKPFDDEAIIETVRRALQLRPAANPEIVQRIAQLTPREREVLEGLVAGHANKVIAYELDISPRTVEIHRARVMEKMQARSLSQLVRMALEAGVAPPGA
ncbi:response regulator FixJ [Skermanella mucosa]|uniref:response regulator FixJ n=1 Tax=Skermanella mucosa TaxID=1789672 RepID=UPI002B21B393|nr:response regulator FixJ [Skermanella mucosa]